MKDQFTELLRFGINLKLSSPIEDKYYTQRLSHFIMSMPDYDADTEDDENLNIYLKTELILKVQIKDSTLTFEPQSEMAYDGILVVLDFVANLHTMVQDDFQREGYIEGEFSEEVVELNEEDSEDDLDWI